jgi:hypothetical protein
VVASLETFNHIHYSIVVRYHQNKVLQFLCEKFKIVNQRFKNKPNLNGKTLWVSQGQDLESALHSLGICVTKVLNQ